MDARPFVTDCSVRLEALFKAGRSESSGQLWQPCDKHVELIPSSAKEREYIIAKRVAKDEARAQKLYDEWQGLLAAERAEREHMEREARARREGIQQAVASSSPSLAMPSGDGATRGMAGPSAEPELMCQTTVVESRPSFYQCGHARPASRNAAGGASRHSQNASCG